MSYPGTSRWPRHARWGQVDVVEAAAVLGRKCGWVPGEVVGQAGGQSMPDAVMLMWDSAVLCMRRVLADELSRGAV
jgi:hypothetical protein